MQVMPITEIGSNVSIGAITGSTGSNEFLDQINQELSGGSGVFFGQSDRYRDHYQSFLDRVITPIVKTTQIIKNTNQRLINRDMIRPIHSVEDLELGIPVSMELPILTYAPIKQMLKEETIYGFGYEYDHIKDIEDVYGRLISNGTVQLNGPNADEYIEHTWRSTDPIHTFDDLDHIEDTRLFIDSFLEEHGDIDITDYPNAMGKIK